MGLGCPEAPLKRGWRSRKGSSSERALALVGALRAPGSGLAAGSALPGGLPIFLFWQGCHMRLRHILAGQATGAAAAPLAAEGYFHGLRAQGARMLLLLRLRLMAGAGSS